MVILIDISSYRDMRSRSTALWYFALDLLECNSTVLEYNCIDSTTYLLEIRVSS